MFTCGGNDYAANTVVTYDDDSYSRYNTIRGGGAGQTKCGGIALARQPHPHAADAHHAAAGRSPVRVHPAMTGLVGLFNSGKAAVQLNVGRWWCH